MLYKPETIFKSVSHTVFHRQTPEVISSSCPELLWDTWTVSAGKLNGLMAQETVGAPSLQGIDVIHPRPTPLSIKRCWLHLSEGEHAAPDLGADVLLINC